MQKALDVKYDKMVGTLALDEVNQHLADGWKFVEAAPGYSGDILVIVEKEETAQV